MKNTIVTLRFFLIMTVITGIAYPLLVTGIAQAIWPAKAGGSLILKNGEVIGSSLIAQKFEKETYFWPRPSAADYNAAASGGSNKGPTNADLKKAFDEGKAKGLPEEMIFASASGLDPHLSPHAALYQVSRVARARGLTQEQGEALRKLVESSVESRDLGFLGQPRVNVFMLNVKLDEKFP